MNRRGDPLAKPFGIRNQTFGMGWGDGLWVEREERMNERKVEECETPHRTSADAGHAWGLLGGKGGSQPRTKIPFFRYDFTFLLNFLC